MAVGKGFSAICALKRKTTKGWGSGAIALGANNGIRILSESVTPTIEVLPDDSLGVGAVRQKGDTVSQQVAGSFPTYLKYDGLEAVLLMCFGHARSAPVKKGTAPQAYLNEFTWKDSVDGYYATFAVDKQVAIHEIDSVKIGSFTIAGDAGGRVMLTVELIGRKFSNSSSVNATLSSVTEPTPRKYVLYSEGKFRMNLQSAAALANADNFYPSAFEVTFSRNMDGILTSSGYFDEPTETDFTGITGSFTLPKYESTTHENNFIAGNVMKADIRFKAGSINTGNYYYQFCLFIPQLQITEAAREVGNAGRIAAPLSWEATKANTAPAGMTGAGPGQGVQAQSRASHRLPAIEIMNVSGDNPAAGG